MSYSVTQGDCVQRFRIQLQYPQLHIITKQNYDMNSQTKRSHFVSLKVQALRGQYFSRHAEPNASQ